MLKIYIYLNINIGTPLALSSSRQVRTRSVWVEQTELDAVIEKETEKHG